MRADALLVMVDLSEAPLAQMTEIISQLENMRIGIGEVKSDPEATLRQKKAIIAGNKLDKDGAGQNYNRLRARYGEHLPMTAISAVIFLVSAEYNMATAYIIGRVENNDYGLAIAYSTTLIGVMLAAVALLQFLVGRTQIGRRGGFGITGN
ncbi:MAG: hypothetical protein ACC631_11460, partial [Halocynthiibacter sp.]